MCVHRYNIYIHKKQTMVMCRAEKTAKIAFAAKTFFFFCSSSAATDHITDISFSSDAAAKPKKP